MALEVPLITLKVMNIQRVSQVIGKMSFMSFFKKGKEEDGGDKDWSAKPQYCRKLLNQTA